MLPSFFETAKIGTAHLLCLTGSSSPSSSCVWRVASTWSQNAKEMLRLLQNFGRASLVRSISASATYIAVFLILLSRLQDIHLSMCTVVASILCLHSDTSANLASSILHLYIQALLTNCNCDSALPAMLFPIIFPYVGNALPSYWCRMVVIMADWAFQCREQLEW